MTDEEYRALLIEKGGEDLSEHTYTSAFEGQIDITRMYKYRQDFFNGDIVQLINEKELQVTLSEKMKGRLALFDNYENHFNAIKEFLIK